MAARLCPRLTAGLSSLALATGALASAHGSSSQPQIAARSKPVITVDGQSFHDLSGDGRLQPYEDWRLSAEERARDLVARMTLREKAGLMMHGTPPTADGSFRGNWDVEGMRAAIEADDIRFFIHRMSGDVKEMAQLTNAAQEIAEGTRLGVPLVFSSDSRNTLREVLGVSVAPKAFTRWPEALGLSAIGDLDLIRDLSRIAAREYKAIGIRMALSPQADLFTEPRWFRGNATFGDRPEQVAPMVQAYIEGFQGGPDGLQRGGVATVVKHWGGYGAQVDGLDSHNPYGKYMKLTDATLAQHLAAFEGAFKVHSAAVMPTYSLPAPGLTVNGTPVEPVGVGFNRQLLDESLRGQHGFEGFVMSDWLITADCPDACLKGTFDVDKLGMPWGVEDLTVPERFAKGIEAGIDQFGGVMETDVVVDLVRSGALDETRVDRSARRIAKVMFQLGLFENAYVDAEASAQQVGTDDARALALDAQHRSVVLLENKGGILPLAPASARRAWLVGVDADAARLAGFTPVEAPEQADVALLRLAAPFTSHPDYFFGSSAHEGPLTMGPGDPGYEAVAKAHAAGIAIIADIYLDRPAVLTPVQPMVDALMGDYGITDAAFLDIVTGRARPEGKLPVELPRSDAAVAAQRGDVPSDSVDPLYPQGFGMELRRGPTP
ncbi:MAG: glycoside hydrolase family 3 N-terminal domain-containing protein [Pseudomonadota bacterium]|nr:glycoside hydrolase family 3 N-terminal domain-containing protein [Pseudomonadota bacterium]